MPEEIQEEKAEEVSEEKEYADLVAVLETEKEVGQESYEGDTDKWKWSA